MDLRLLAAISGELDGVNVAALCRANGISRKTFYKWRDRYKNAGLTGLEARSRRPHRSPQQMPSHVEDLIVEKRKWLLDYGLDAGAASIRHQLEGRASPVPSEATIWRALVRRGQITPGTSQAAPQLLSALGGSDAEPVLADRRDRMGDRERNRGDREHHR